MTLSIVRQSNIVQFPTTRNEHIQDSLPTVVKPNWVKQGVLLNPEDSVQDWAKAASLDYTVCKQPTLYAAPYGAHDGSERPILSLEDSYVLSRSDTGQGFATVSNKYHVHQPIVILTFIKMCCEMAGLDIHSAGFMDDGKHIWVVAKIRDYALRGKDIVSGFVRIITSYTGKSATRFFGWLNRLVCQNGLTMPQGLGEFRMTHSRRFTEHHAEEAARKLQLIPDYMEDYVKQLEALARTPVPSDKSKIIEFFVELYDLEDINTRTENKVKQLLTAFHASPGANLDTAKGTLWGLHNAVTYYEDHVAKPISRGNSSSDNAWLKRSWLNGSSEQRKERAHKMLLEMAG